MKIYQVFSWSKQIYAIPKYYFFVNKDAADKFVKYLDKVQPNHEHQIQEMEAYSHTTQCKDDKVILANYEDNGLIVDAKGDDTILPHDCNFCVYSGGGCNHEEKFKDSSQANCSMFMTDRRLLCDKEGSDCCDESLDSDYCRCYHERSAICHF